MTYLFFGDIHLTERDIPEIDDIFSEILILKDKYCVNKVIITGDTFDRINPTSIELDCFSSFISKLNIPIILLSANSHESTTLEESVINHFGILKSNVLVCKEYVEDNKLFVGHFIVKDSSKNYGGTRTKSELTKYKNVILGHGHNYEVIKPNICQLGSVRFVDFGEDVTLKKKVAICTDFETDKPKWRFIDLNSPISMISLELGQNTLKTSKIEAVKGSLPIENSQPPSPGKQIQAQKYDIPSLKAYLDLLTPRNKVRLVFKDYGFWKEFLPYSTIYKEKFFIYKEQKAFVISTVAEVSSKHDISLRQSLLNYLLNTKTPQDIQDILLKELHE